MNISSNTLFHFTDKIENVISILKEEFRPHFCLEDLNDFVAPDDRIEELEHAIPMVCFCDIPLSQSMNHRKTYGNYGIGLSKEWGKNNKVSPVLYAHQNSAITDTILQMWIEVNKPKKLSEQQDDGNLINGFYDYIPYVGETITRTEPVDDHANRFYDYIYGIYCFTKPCDGRRWMNRDKRYSEETVTFCDEREWRFVPMCENRFEYGLSKKEILDCTEQSYVNYELEKLSVLHFKPSDIKYIIVSNDDEIVYIITEIEQIMDGYNQADIKLLSSKLISAEQIDEDF